MDVRKLEGSAGRRTGWNGVVLQWGLRDRAALQGNAGQSTPSTAFEGFPGTDRQLGMIGRLFPWDSATSWPPGRPAFKVVRRRGQERRTTPGTGPRVPLSAPCCDHRPEPSSPSHGRSPCRRAYALIVRHLPARMEIDDGGTLATILIGSPSFCP